MLGKILKFLLNCFHKHLFLVKFILELLLTFSLSLWLVSLGDLTNSPPLIQHHQQTSL